MPTADEIVNALGLKPLAGEGGFFRRTWVLPSQSGRPAGSAILYLVTPESFSTLHRLDADEVFHFYLGDDCEQITIDPAANLTTTTLGPDILGGHQVQTVVPQGYWQGTRLVKDGTWALLGSTMAPGYHQAGFELASLDDLAHLPEEIVPLATSYLAEQA